MYFVEDVEQSDMANACIERDGLCRRSCLYDSSVLIENAVFGSRGDDPRSPTLMRLELKFS